MMQGSKRKPIPWAANGNLNTHTQSDSYENVHRQRKVNDKSGPTKKSGQLSGATRPEQDIIQQQQAAADQSAQHNRLDALQTMANRQPAIHVPASMPKSIPIQRRFAGKVIQKKDEDQQKPVSANENEVAPGPEKKTVRTNASSPTPPPSLTN
jgi:hypothetical protein